MKNHQVALITGGAKRVGATIARHLHSLEMDLILHYHHSETEARRLQAELQQQRPDSVWLLQANLLNIQELTTKVQQAIAHYNRLDVLINNASTYYPTPLEQATEQQWEDLLGTNLKAPFFLARTVAPALRLTAGCIINLVDIHAKRPLKNHPIYSTAKAGLMMLTQALAIELAPQVRVNAIAPGAILWPESPQAITETTKQDILTRIALSRLGNPNDIVQAVEFLIQKAGYITGQIITIDGGRTLYQ